MFGGLQNHREGPVPRAKNAAHPQKTGLLGGSAWRLPSTPPPLSIGIFSGEGMSPPPAISIL